MVIRYFSVYVLRAVVATKPLASGSLILTTAIFLFITVLATKLLTPVFFFQLF